MLDKEIARGGEPAGRHSNRTAADNVNTITDYLATAPPPRFGESDLDACRRIFRGHKFNCRLCGEVIEWIGVCDGCDYSIRVGTRRLYSEAVR